LGRQVEVGEAAAVEDLWPVLVVPQQFGHRIVVSLGLDDASAGDLPHLAHRAVHRAEQGIGFAGQGAGALPQGAGEEGVEALVGLRVADGGLLQVDAEVADRLIDQPLFQRRPGAVGELPHHPGEGVVGQGILGWPRTGAP
jgi:hypothetical protein